MRLLFDRDVLAALTPVLAVEAARKAVVDAYTGELAAPPRLHADLGGNGLVFTAGGYAAGPLGVRAYGLWPGPSDQAVLVWNGDGELRGAVIGRELGALRTGALGAVAVDVLARPDATTLGMLGSGAQAWAQVWAIQAVRRIERLTVFSPTEDRRRAFAARVSDELGIEAVAVDEPEQAVRGADVLVVATRSPTPVLDASWVEPGAHVTTVGPKTISGHELPAELATRAAIVASDAPQQAEDYGEPFFTSRPLDHVGRFLVEAPLQREPGAVTLYCSTGLAGSEVVLADALLRAVDPG